jgi:hypothetical protein
MGEKRGTVVWQAVLFAFALFNIAYWINSWAGPVLAVAGVLAFVMMMGGAILWRTSRQHVTESEPRG